MLTGYIGQIWGQKKKKSMYSIDIISTAWHLKKNNFQNKTLLFYIEIFQIRLSEKGNKN